MRQFIFACLLTVTSALIAIPINAQEAGKGVMAANVKIKQSNGLTAAQLIERTKELNQAFETNLLAGFEPGKAQTPQQALFALHNAFRQGDPSSAHCILTCAIYRQTLQKLIPSHWRADCSLFLRNKTYST
jgi:hypothetical protein